MRPTTGDNGLINNATKIEQLTKLKLSDAKGLLDKFPITPAILKNSIENIKKIDREISLQI